MKNFIFAIISFIITQLILAMVYPIIGFNPNLGKGIVTINKVIDGICWIALFIVIFTLLEKISSKFIKKR